MSCPRLQKLDLSWNCLDTPLRLQAPRSPNQCSFPLSPALQQLGQSLSKHRGGPEKLSLAGCSGRWELCRLETWSNGSGDPLAF